MLTVTNVQYFVLYFHHQRLHQSAHTSMIHKTKTEKYYRFMSRCQLNQLSLFSCYIIGSVSFFSFVIVLFGGNSKPFICQVANLIIMFFMLLFLLTAHLFCSNRTYFSMFPYSLNSQHLLNSYINDRYMQEQNHGSEESGRERARERETVQQRRDYSTCVMIYSYLMVITKSYVRFGVEKEKYQVFVDEPIFQHMLRQQ